MKKLSTIVTLILLSVGLVGTTVQSVSAAVNEPTEEYVDNIKELKALMYDKDSKIVHRSNDHYFLMYNGLRNGAGDTTYEDMVNIDNLLTEKNKVEIDTMISNEKDNYPKVNIVDNRIEYDTQVRKSKMASKNAGIILCVGLLSVLILGVVGIAISAAQ